MNAVDLGLALGGEVHDVRVELRAHWTLLRGSVRLVVHENDLCHEPQLSTDLQAALARFGEDDWVVAFERLLDAAMRELSAGISSDVEATTTAPADLHNWFPL